MQINIKTSDSIQAVIEYIECAEFGGLGRIDTDDPWYPTYKSLLELKEKALEDEATL